MMKHVQNLYACAFCTESFTSASFLVTHVKTAHKANIEEENLYTRDHNTDQNHQIANKNIDLQCREKLYSPVSFCSLSF